ncbi:Transcriptional regulator, AraC family protein [Minicystis rosea]|nr:Transcriptional regulator, AraC family protein [Minicystis rosea]
MIRIAVLAYDGCIASSVTGPLDVLAVGNQSWSVLHPGAGPFCETVLVAPGGSPVRSFQGLALLPQQALEGSGPWDVVVVPAASEEPDAILARVELIEWLSACHRQGACLGAVCAGSFLLAGCGVLGARPATTHWRLAERFRERFPSVPLKPDQMLIDGGDYVCAGGVTAYLDLALHLVARFASPETAAMTARLLLIDPNRRTQRPYEVFQGRKGHGDVAVLRAQEWLEARTGSEKITMRGLARAAGLGERTLLRRFQKATGDTPRGYLQALRVEVAKRLLETTDLGMDQITTRAGATDPSSFRRLFKLRTGLTPGEYRRRFAVRGAPEALADRADASRAKAAPNRAQRR